jgi:uncharacterized membrane protein YqaE (UPF0057 family)
MKAIFTRLFFAALFCGMLIPHGNAAMIVPAHPVSVQPDAVTIKSAMEEFKNLSKKEKREKFREVKKALKEYKAEGKSHKDAAASTVLQVIFAILIPPLGVFLHEGVINSKFWIDLLLTLLFFLPGMIYALVIVLGDK